MTNLVTVDKVRLASILAEQETEKWCTAKDYVQTEHGLVLAEHLQVFYNSRYDNYLNLIEENKI
jgi:hypothetical protein